ncbi:hypothetical protein [Thalassobius sp. I31.1]|uniref:hypothetical protein n=1 Tax=Thalassobius sp. I31.1 TaxID=2109912 RepID=UPI00130059A6|nr:hypothetical protein [Thalassobius sp. I31.1]
MLNTQSFRRLCIVLLPLLLAFWYLRPSTPLGEVWGKEQFDAMDTFRVTEETPFRIAGMTPERILIENGSPHALIKYGIPRYLYPTANNCLTGENTAQISERNLRWNEFKNEAELEVCLFRVLSKMSTRETVLPWIASQDIVDLHIYTQPSAEEHISASFAWFPQEGAMSGAFFAGAPHDGPETVQLILVFLSFDETGQYLGYTINLITNQNIRKTGNEYPIRN